MRISARTKQQQKQCDAHSSHCVVGRGLIYFDVLRCMDDGKKRVKRGCGSGVYTGAKVYWKAN